MANITKLNESPNLTHQIYPSQQSTRFMSRSKDEFEYFPEEYFCLTDNNFLIINRDGKILQIRPSEFEDGDFLPSVDEKNNFVWAKAICTKRIVPKGDKIVRLCSRGGIFDLTVGHKIFIENGNTVAAGNLKKRDKLLKIPCYDFPVDGKVSEDLAFVLGAFGAEGSSQKGQCKLGTGKWRVVFALHLDEIGFANRIAHSVASIGDYNPMIRSFSKYTRTTVGVYSKNFVEFLENLGALGLCYEKRIPSCVFDASVEAKVAYLAGMVLGDGFWNKNRIVVTLTSKALIEGIHVLLSSLGIRSSVAYHNKEKQRGQRPNTKNAYSVSVYGKQNIRKFLDMTKSYLCDWKWTPSVIGYIDKEHGNRKYSADDKAILISTLSKEFPISLYKFWKKTGISQSTIDRLFGSWNMFVKSAGFNPNPGGQKKRKFVDYDKDQYNGCLVDRLFFKVVEEDIPVFDFEIPFYNKFAIGTVVSHNSSSAISLYFENIFIDEVTRLSFSLQEQVMPIYGYNDYVPAVYARGSRIIQGQFGINFKEAYYLRRILSHAASQKNRVNLLEQSRTTLEEFEALRLAAQVLGIKGSITKEGLAKAKLDAKKTSDEKRLNLLESLDGNAFELISTAYELALWGEDETTPPSWNIFDPLRIPGQSGAGKLLKNALKGIPENPDLSEQGIFNIIEGIKNSSKNPHFKQSATDGLFITIEYGEVKRFTRSSGKGEKIKVQTGVDEEGNPTFQDRDIENVENITGRSLNQVEYVPGTVKTLSNVQITGESQNIDLDGRPIENLYNFICSDSDISPKNR